MLRADEWREGVIVRDAAGEPRGRSAAAGRFAVAATVATRIVYLLPMLVLPYAHRAAVAALPRAPPLALYAALSAAASATATPAAMALFDQQAALPSSELEGELRTLRGEDGQPILLFFNKGL